jgi:hypothetical protein
MGFPLEVPMLRTQNIIYKSIFLKFDFVNGHSF